MLSAIDTVSVLVVSRDAAVLRCLRSAGESNAWDIENATGIWQAIEGIQSGPAPDLFLLDLPWEEMDGIHMLRWLRRMRPAMPILLIDGTYNAERNLEARRMGATEYFVKPLDDIQLEAAMKKHLRLPRNCAAESVASEDVEVVDDEHFFAGISPAMRRLRAQVASLAEADSPVLIVGEHGAGKETVARLLHKLSIRSGFEFARVNCAALPSDLLEKEIFGSWRDGNIKPGKLDLCSKGTLLLDEISEMPMEMQGRLLQILQGDRSFRSAEADSIEADVRIIASSSANLEHAVSQNKLREELYYCLSAYMIHVPPLRERKDEIPLLSHHFMHRFARQFGLSTREFSPLILEMWKAYPWPGNLPELETFVKRYLMAGEKGLVSQHRQLSPDEMNGKAETAAGYELPSAETLSSTRPMPAVDSLKSLVESVKLDAEKSAIAAALEKTGWNRKAAARLLNVSYRTLLYKIERYQMTASAPLPLPRASVARIKSANLEANSSK